MSPRAPGRSEPSTDGQETTDPEDATLLEHGGPRFTFIAGKGPLDGRAFSAQGADVTLGRSRRCSIVLPLPLMSRKHARLAFRNGEFWLSDFETRNGTRVNGVPIDGKIALASGDLVRMGGQEFTFTLGHDTGASASMPTAPSRVQVSWLLEKPARLGVGIGLLLAAGCALCGRST